MTSFQRLRKTSRAASKKRGHKLGTFLEEGPGVFIARCLYCDKKVVLDNDTHNGVMMLGKIIKNIRGVILGDPLIKKCKGDPLLKDKEKSKFVGTFANISGVGKILSLSTTTTGNYIISSNTSAVTII